MAAVLIRHTRLEGNTGYCYGRHAFPLAASFPAEAQRVRTQLPWRPTNVWSSPADRCRRLAEILAEGAPLQLCPELAELDFGEWEGCRWDDLRGAAVDAWMADPWRARPPGGETAVDLLERVGRMRDTALRATGERLAIVTHAGVIRAWLSLSRGMTLDQAFSLPVGYGDMLPAE